MKYSQNEKDGGGGAGFPSCYGSYSLGIFLQILGKSQARSVKKNFPTTLLTKRFMCQ